jgi:transposase-like protein
MKAVLATSRPVAQVAKELSVHEATLGSCVNTCRPEQSGAEPPLTVNERARMLELKRESRELRMENEFLRTCSRRLAPAPQPDENRRGRPVLTSAHLLVLPNVVKAGLVPQRRRYSIRRSARCQTLQPLAP